MHKTQFPRLLEAIDEEEHLDACDKLARGEVKTEELDARLATASPRIKAIREMSEPFNADFHQRLGDILERPPAAKAPAVDVTPIALRSRRKPPLRAVHTRSRDPQSFFLLNQRA